MAFNNAIPSCPPRWGEVKCVLFFINFFLLLIKKKYPEGSSDAFLNL